MNKMVVMMRSFLWHSHPYKKLSQDMIMNKPAAMNNMFITTGEKIPANGDATPKIVANRGNPQHTT